MEKRANVMNVRERMTGAARRWALWYQLAVVFAVIACIMNGSVMAQRFALGQTMPAGFLLCVFVLYIPALWGTWRLSAWAMPLVCLLFVAHDAEPWLFHTLQPKLSHKDILKFVVLVVGTVGCVKVRAAMKNDSSSAGQ